VSFQSSRASIQQGRYQIPMIQDNTLETKVSLATTTAGKEQTERFLTGLD
jgi:hypothetical protein